MSDYEVRFNMDLAFRDGDHRQHSLYSRDELGAVRDDTVRAAARIEEARGWGPLAFLELPYGYSAEAGGTIFGNIFADTLATMKTVAADFAARRGQFVHVGIGGSALGAITLVNALAAPDARRNVYVTDNVDPDGLQEIFAELDPGRVYANVVSKSGDTVETIATFACLWELLQRAGSVQADDLRRRIFVTTNPEQGALAALARSHGFRILPLPDVIHGRFSVFSPMGLLAATVAGIDIERLLAGAQAADQDSREQPFEANAALQLAALHFVGLKSGRIANLILMPYSDRLRTIADWYSQLVAESLGKEGQGLTPVKALGVTDQHSQLQLYNDGPKNRLVVLFTVGSFRHVLNIPASIAEISAYEYLAGKSINELFNAERRATEVSLHLHGVPSCRFELKELNPFTLGYLLTVLEKCVCIVGELCGVNAFDQPGVEESKEYARAMLGASSRKYDELRRVVAELSPA